MVEVDNWGGRRVRAGRGEVINAEGKWEGILIISAAAPALSTYETDSAKYQLMQKYAHRDPLTCTHCTVLITAMRGLNSKTPVIELVFCFTVITGHHSLRCLKPFAEVQREQCSSLAQQKCIFTVSYTRPYSVKWNSACINMGAFATNMLAYKNHPFYLISHHCCG